jgi:NADH-quinone oxidoreductase subunit J
VWFEQLLFFFAAFGALGGAIGVVTLRNPFYSVLALVSHLLSLSVLFLLLRAEFIAAAQVVVYAGAVMVLYVFVVAYIGGVAETMGSERRQLRTFGPIFAGALLVEIAIAIVGSGLKALDTRGPDVPPGFGSPSAIGQLLLERFLIAFEAASFLLVIAAVGAVVLAGRRRGLEDVEGDTLAEGAARHPGPPTGGAGGPQPKSTPLENVPTRIPSGTAEGMNDPAAKPHSPDHETQDAPEPVGS